ncbi:MAG: cation:dicarboxylate symporter family transporter [Thermoactinomyces vulgaris]
MKKMSLTKKILIGILLGLIVGVILNLYFPSAFVVLNQYLFDPVSNLFIKAIKMVVVPLVFFLAGFGSCRHCRSEKNWGASAGEETIILYILTTAIAITFAIILANIIQPGTGVTIDQPAEEVKVDKPPSMIDTLVNIVPGKPG